MVETVKVNKSLPNIPKKNITELNELGESEISQWLNWGSPKEPE